MRLKIALAAVLISMAPVAVADPPHQAPLPDPNRVIAPALPLVVWARIYHAMESSTDPHRDVLAIETDLQKAVDAADKPSAVQKQK